MAGMFIPGKNGFDPTSGLYYFNGTEYISPAEVEKAKKRAAETNRWNKLHKGASIATGLYLAGVGAPIMAGAGAAASAGTAATSTLPSTSLIPGALATPGAGTAASVLPSTSLIPGALKTVGASSMTPQNAYFAAEGVKAAANLFGAKKGSSAATKSADTQATAMTKAAELQSGSAAAQLAYLKEQAELDRLSKRFTDRQNYGLSKAGMENDFSRYGDMLFNTRASELSQGRTQDKVYAGRQNQMNYMRNLLRMPQNELSVYVEPDALQLTRPTLPDYVEDTTPTRTT